MSKTIHQREHVIKDIEDWPIYKLSQDRREFVEALITFCTGRLMDQPLDKIQQDIAKTIYLERIRVKEEPWKVDPPNDRQFWRKQNRRLAGISQETPNEERRAIYQELLERIIRRYAEEIVGTFKVKTFRFARKFLTMLFTRLLNTAASRNFKRFYGHRFRLQDRLMVKGDVEKSRALFRKGHYVVVPTHFSNLDSILIGYALDTAVGLPAFSYGAGLNLYNTGYTAYFMNRLGAYRVDRRKKNPIYLETLKAMCTLSLERGTNNIFFPGGTRSRSGELENKLKMGLLGTAVEAQRRLFQNGQDEKIVVVPLILGYHFVLEAEFLIEQHLQKVGKENYLRLGRDQGSSVRKIFKFIWELFSKSNEIVVTLGEPMDVMGNLLDEEGRSFDQYGNEIDLKDYFRTSGTITADRQREREYTKIMAERIVERFHKDNTVLTSHLVAFSAFLLLQQEHPGYDLYALLRLPTDEHDFSEDKLLPVIEQLQGRLKEMAEKGDVRISGRIATFAPLEILRDGVRRLGTYHSKKPLHYNKSGALVSDSFKVLYFYHNRLEHYNLDRFVDWNAILPTTTE